MSLMRSISRRFSGNRPSRNSNNAPAPTPIQLVDPVVQKPSLSAGNMFEGTMSTAGQSTNMDRTLYEIPMPDAVDAMTDHIKDHTPGDFFPYVGVVGQEGEAPDARRARMLALKPSYNKRDVPEIIVSGCPLISREGQFTMSSLMTYASQNTSMPTVSSGPMPSGSHNKDFSISKAFVHIRQVTAVYTPNVSSTSNYCSFWMNLIDTRLIDPDKGCQTNVVVSNQESVLEASCDYCIPTRELSSFVLTYTLERDIVNPGHQWGTASFYFSITESDLPYQSSKVDAMAVYRMPITTLMERKTNADKSDISFTPDDIKRLRELYKAGDIVDVDEPQHARLKTNLYSKSSIRTAPKGPIIESGNREGWEFTKGNRRARVDADEASINPPSEDGKEEFSIDPGEAKRSRAQALENWKLQQEKDKEEMARLLRESQPAEKEVVPDLQQSGSSIASDDHVFGNLFDQPAQKKPKKTVRLSPSAVG